MNNKLVILSALVAAALLSACSIFDDKTPVPEDKKSYVGLWKTESGFTLDLRENGAAYIKQIGASGNPVFDAVTIMDAPLNSPEMLALFQGDTSILLLKPMYFAKEYKIDRAPFQDKTRTKMVLNGVAFVKQ